MKLEPVAYRVPDVARALGTTEAAVRNMIAREQIPTRKIGRRVIVLPDELMEFVRTRPRPEREVA